VVGFSGVYKQPIGTTILVASKRDVGKQLKESLAPVASSISSNDIFYKFI
jgi:hypothetical protein